MRACPSLYVSSLAMVITSKSIFPVSWFCCIVAHSGCCAARGPASAAATGLCSGLPPPSAPLWTSLQQRGWTSRLALAVGLCSSLKKRPFQVHISPTARGYFEYQALTHTEHTLWSVCKEEGGPGVASDGSRRNLNSLSDPWETLGTLHTKLAREGMIRLCIEIQLDTDSEKLWAVQSGRFEARSLALSLARSLSSRSPSPSQHFPSSSSRDHSPAQ